MSVLHIDSLFSSEGVSCIGTLMLPTAAQCPPLILMANGFGGIRMAALPQIAQHFVNDGYAVFFFDYRNFGDSAGEPRHWISPRRHLADWKAALNHVRNFSNIDVDNIILWGTSFSGGHVICTAAREAGIRAVIAQVPHVSGIASVLQVPLHISTRLTIAALRDRIGSLFGKPHYSRIVGHPGELAALTSPECWDGYAKLNPPGAVWENKVLSRIFLELPFYSPIRYAREVQVPTLIIAGSRDSVTPASAAARTAQRIPFCEFHLLDGNHFELHLTSEQVCQQSIALQLAFLRKHIRQRSFAS
ncbi:alpha/beta fold hydrolase [Pseudoduganella sp. FT93W]|uniref:Alpha/beta fold hydrolase n=1 Tax=Duganella fentianensis TaxID=2692177 RepID=A0A845I0X9_9BURK|nr:alpha/beta fold hydrolase [Duganella fentianensis]MYN44756.1 alpha/beta fold hydrolase [Duganella fentianensis]